MGIGMQIVYSGFGGSARVEAEACVQLLRLERMGARLAGCGLTIEAREGGAAYRVGLALTFQDGATRSLAPVVDEDACAALQRMFDGAEAALRATVG
jgi:hypothetical protein